jgi:hypothetical protein
MGCPSDERVPDAQATHAEEPAASGHSQNVPRLLPPCAYSAAAASNT